MLELNLFDATLLYSSCRDEILKDEYCKLKYYTNLISKPIGKLIHHKTKKYMRYKLNTENIKKINDYIKNYCEKVIKAHNLKTLKKINGGRECLT